MNRRILITGLLALSVALFTGCTTVGKDGTRVPDVEKNAKIAASVKAAVASTVYLVVKKNPQTADYFLKVSYVFCQAEATSEINPALIIQQINGIPAVQNAPTELLIAKNLIVGLLEANFGSTWSIALNPQRVGGIVTTVLCEGISTGVHDAGGGPQANAFDDFNEQFAKATREMEVWSQ